jgi:hypothetical protein
MSDPFESNINNILDSRKKVAKQIVAARLTEEDTSVNESSILDRLPYEISKTVQYINSNEYKKQQKALKKQSDTV